MSFFLVVSMHDVWKAGTSMGYIVCLSLNRLESVGWQVVCPLGIETFERLEKWFPRTTPSVAWVLLESVWAVEKGDSKGL